MVQSHRGNTCFKDFAPILIFGLNSGFSKIGPQYQFIRKMNFQPLVKILTKFFGAPSLRFLTVQYYYVLITKRSKFENSPEVPIKPRKLVLKLVKNGFSMMKMALILSPKPKPLVIMVPLRHEKYQKSFFQFLKNFLGKIGHVKNRPPGKISQIEGQYWSEANTFDINDWMKVLEQVLRNKKMKTEFSALVSLYGKSRFYNS